jgi:hypothetical protein
MTNVILPDTSKTAGLLQATPPSMPCEAISTSYCSELQFKFQTKLVVHKIKLTRRDQRLTHWKLFLAFAFPGFFLSTTRESLVKKPAAKTIKLGKQQGIMWKKSSFDNCMEEETQADKGKGRYCTSFECRTQVGFPILQGPANS